MGNTDMQRVTELRALIAGFLKKRLDDKLDKLRDDDPKRAELHQQFIPENWLANAARRISQIQAVTHSLKPAHPDAKGTSLYSPPDVQPVLTVVGSHCLGNEFTSDVVGNAAALDVYKFLKLEHEGYSLLALSMARDADLATALSNDPAQAQAWISAFGGLAERPDRLASHTLAKQLYWPVGDDPHDDGSFHLLAPLYASSLAHRVYQTVQDDRFSEEAIAARQAKKESKYSARAVREYPDLAIQKLGGTKPQNISQLNSERRGDNLLFASLLPTWRSIDVKPLLGSDSMFPRFNRRPEVRRMVKALLAFLKSDPTRNLETRRRRAEWVDGIIDEFLQFRAELRPLPPGWSQTPACHLSNEVKHWLDPEGVEWAPASEGLPPPTDTAERVSALFANWLNAQLRDPLPMGDPEFLEWRNRMYEQIKAEEREGRHDD
ncbi:type I-F CRISPR-associated protein Csy1 [Nitrosospira sp. Nsp1]|uniref:type I-F CRISPR-associated protein Csy1 n=1 Tax=Nitrosospira sp. Nsp1 TaxID=136547 RepID=UPI00088715B5|nr:type I-F CRISPR-associated protein Csy1 [Nitrosospira sp. Nsp1]SCX55094.1 CRISPR-associated protein, Csy1 family [Nitrosospira sp. Nsp1]